MIDLDALLANLAGCLKTEVEAGWPEGGELAFAGVWPGDQVQFDYIDDDCGGMAWVRIVTFYPSTGVGVISNATGSCDAWTVDIELGVIRCFEVTEEAPSVEYLATVSNRQNADMLSIIKAVKCCSSLLGKDYILQPYVPVLAANAVGGGMLLMVGIL